MESPAATPLPILNSAFPLRGGSFVPDFWAQTVAIAAKNRNAAMAERDVFAILSAARAIRPRFMSITHATEVAAAPTRQMSVNHSLMQSTAIVYQNLPPHALRRRLLLYRQAKARFNRIDGNILVCNAKSTSRNLDKIP